MVADEPIIIIPEELELSDNDTLVEMQVLMKMLGEVDELEVLVKIEFEPHRDILEMDEYEY